MPAPQVVIVGRPNVGKSSLFNWLAHKRIAITDATAGVTRDRVTYHLDIDERVVELIDTGGMGHIDEDNLTAHVEAQIQYALNSASLVLFVVDTKDGLMSADWDIDRRLRALNVPVILVANKSDSPNLEVHADEFHRLGRSPFVKVSVQANRGLQELLKVVRKNLPPADFDEELPADAMMKLAIVGRRNTGKSTFINSIAETERMIVSEIPGTTRDSVDVRFELDGKSFIAIDTPGLRRRKSVQTNVDYFGLHRAQRAIRRADVVFLFFDAGEEISRVDKQLVDYIDENYKPCIFVVNKWDTYAGKVATEEWATYLHETFRSMLHVPIAFITAKTGKNTKTLLNHGQMLFKQAQQRVSTADLNKLLQAAITRNPPPSVKNLRAKIFYGTQVSTQPPTLVLVVNSPTAFTNTYKRYLLNTLRDDLDFGEIPIKMYLRRRAESATSRSDTETEDYAAEAESFAPDMIEEVWEEGE